VLLLRTEFYNRQEGCGEEEVLALIYIVLRSKLKPSKVLTEVNASAKADNSV